MEGIVKSVQQITQEPTKISQSTEHMPLSYDGVPIDFLNHFDVGFSELTVKTKKQLTEIYEILKPKHQSMGDLLWEIKDIERKLGPTQGQETRYGRIWNWVKISRRIGELEKERQSLGYG